MPVYPQITVICSIYNVAEYLDKFISTMKAQTFQDFVVLFINDGTQDNSIDIIKKYSDHDEHFQYVHVDINHHIYQGNVPDDYKNAVNYGIYATRNTALQLVQSEYLTFIDPDDWVENDYLNKLFYAAEERHADIAKGELCKNYENGRVQIPTSNIEILREKHQGIPIARLFCGSQAITCLWRTSFIKKYNLRYKDRTDGFDYDSDDIFLLEALLHHPTIDYCFARYHYVQRNTSAVHTINHKRFTSTPKSRKIEIQLLNRALASEFDYPLSKLHYAIIARRIVWELAKHYRIYLKAKDFNTKEYLECCAEVLSQIKWNSSFDKKTFGFIEPLLNGNLKKAHARLSNPIYILLDKVHLLPYGIS